MTETAIFYAILNKRQDVTRMHIEEMLKTTRKRKVSTPQTTRALVPLHELC